MLRTYALGGRFGVATACGALSSKEERPYVPVAITAPTTPATPALVRADPPPPTPPKSRFAPVVVAPSRIDLGAVEDGVIAVGDEVQIDGSLWIPIGLVQGGVDFDRKRWINAGVAEVTAVGGRIAGPLLLSRRYHTGPALPQTVKLGPTGWTTVARAASSHIVRSGNGWVGTVYDLFARNGAFVKLEGNAAAPSWVGGTCGESMSWPLRATGVASTKSGGIFITGTGCDGEVRAFLWPAGSRTPREVSAPAGIKNTSAAIRLGDEIVMIADDKILAGDPEAPSVTWRSLGAPAGTETLAHLQVSGGRLHLLADHRLFVLEGTAWRPLPLPYDLPVTSFAASDGVVAAASGTVIFLRDAPATQAHDEALFRLLEVPPVAGGIEPPRAQTQPSCETSFTLLAPVSPFLPADYTFPETRAQLHEPVVGIDEKIFGPYDVVVVRVGKARARWIATRNANPYTATRVAPAEKFPAADITCDAPEIERALETVRAP